jgi:signal transduction histidine kinase
VTDHGVGIPPEALETIFDRYARVESSKHRRVKGTGLGLPIVREIVTMHGGRAWATSVVGRGSAFHVALPLTGPPITAAQHSPGDAVLAGGDHGVG